MQINRVNLEKQQAAELILQELFFLLKPDRPLAFLDLEATGQFHQIDRIEEIYIGKIFLDCGISSTWHLVNPEMPACAEAIEAHKITDEMARTYGMKFEDIADSIWALLEDSYLIGYNLSAYDINLFDAEFARVGKSYKTKKLPRIDSYTIWQQMERRRLEDCYERYTGRKLEDAHRASDDVFAVIEILPHQIKTHWPDGVTAHELAEFCKARRTDYVDEEGKLRWRDGQAVFSFGKHPGEKLSSVRRSDPGYLQWMLRSEFADDLKIIVREALQNRFPEKPPLEQIAPS